MALNHAQRKATYLLLYAWAGWLSTGGLVCLLGGLGPTALPASMGGGAILCAITGVLTHRYHRAHPVPTYRRLTSSRAPSTMVGAWEGMALLVVGSCIFAAVALGSAQVTLTAASVLGSLGAIFAILVLFAAQLFIPAWHIENANRLFREHVAHHREAREALERMSLTYDDPKGPAAFGPL